MGLDNRTIIAFGALSTLALLVSAAAVRGSLFRSSRAPGLTAAWTGADACFALGYGLLAFQGTAPVAVSVHLANLLILLGVLLFCASVLLRCGARVPVGPVAVLVAVHVLSFAYFEAVLPSVAARVAVISLEAAAAYAYALRASRSRTGGAFAALRGMFAFQVAFFLFRTIFTLAGERGIASLLSGGTVQTISLVFLPLSFIGNNLALFVSIADDAERELEAGLRSIEAKAAEMEALLALYDETSAGTGLEDLSSRALAALQKAFGVRGAAIYLASETGAGLRLGAVYGLEPSLLQGFGPILPGEGLVSRAYEDRKVYFLRMSEYPDNRFKAPLVASGARSICAFPLTAPSSRPGAVIMLWESEAIPDSKRFSLLQAVGAQLGAVFRNAALVESLKAANDKAEALARTDPLTGLLNRRAAWEILTREAARAARSGVGLAVVLADVDDFKSINDRLGHERGDGFLRRFAAVLGGTGRATDVAVRWGGEEFLAILPGTDERGASAFAQKVRSAFCARNAEEEHDGAMATATFGVAAYSPALRPESIEEAIARADAAMYAGKRSGKDAVVVWTEGME